MFGNDDGDDNDDDDGIDNNDDEVLVLSQIVCVGVRR